MATAGVGHFGLLQLRVRRVHLGKLRVETTGSAEGGGRPTQTIGRYAEFLDHGTAPDARWSPARARWSWPRQRATADAGDAWHARHAARHDAGHADGDDGAGDGSRLHGPDDLHAASAGDDGRPRRRRRRAARTVWIRGTWWWATPDGIRRGRRLWGRTGTRETVVDGFC